MILTNIIYIIFTATSKYNEGLIIKSKISLICSYKWFPYRNIQFKNSETLSKNL